VLVIPAHLHVSFDPGWQLVDMLLSREPHIQKDDSTMVKLMANASPNGLL
jgi:hypothetical protein